MWEYFVFFVRKLYGNVIFFVKYLLSYKLYWYGILWNVYWLGYEEKFRWGGEEIFDIFGDECNKKF